MTALDGNGPAPWDKLLWDELLPLVDDYFRSGAAKEDREVIIMANPGNTGNRYKLRKFAKVEPQEVLYTEKSRLLVTLECGHSYIVLDATPEWYQEQIAKGKRTRCLDCPSGKEK